MEQKMNFFKLNDLKFEMSAYIDKTEENNRSIKNIYDQAASIANRKAEQLKLKKENTKNAFY